MTLSLAGGRLTLTGELTPGARVLAAGYKDGRFVSAKELIFSGEPLSFDAPAWESARVFFFDGETPLRGCVKVN